MVKARLRIDFERPEDLELLKRELIDVGITPSDIACFSESQQADVDYSLKKENQIVRHLISLSLVGLGLSVGLLGKNNFGKSIIVILTLVVIIFVLSYYLKTKLNKSKKMSKRDNCSLSVQVDSKFMEQVQYLISTKKVLWVEIVYGE